MKDHQATNEAVKTCKHCKSAIPKGAKVCPICRKKQGGIGKWIAIAAVIIVIFAAVGGGGGSDSGNNSASADADTPKPASTDTTSNSDNNSSESDDDTPPESESSEQTTYKAGMYLVGKDIPAGEYVVFCDSIAAYMEVASDSSNQLDSIIANENITSHSIVTVSDGQYLTITGGYAVPIGEVADLDISKGGMFKVGTFLPAGEYKVEIDDDSFAGMAYIEVSTDSRHVFDSIKTNDIIENSSYITVSDGEYLTLSGCHIVGQ